MDTLEKILIAIGLDRDKAKDSKPIVQDYIDGILVEYVEKIQGLESSLKELIKQNNSLIEEMKTLKKPWYKKLFK